MTDRFKNTPWFFWWRKFRLQLDSLTVFLYGTVAYLRDDAGNIVVGANGLPKADPQKRVRTLHPDWLGEVFQYADLQKYQPIIFIDAAAVEKYSQEPTASVTTQARWHKP